MEMMNVAIIKAINNKIKNSGTISKAIDYIIDTKTSLVSYENCVGSTVDIASDFEEVRKIHKKNNGILAHHYVQSFSPEDNITPEQAHHIALDFIKKLAPDFQVVVATHIDKGHIHNHFIINSCNIKTGYKWLENQTTLRMMRVESDVLCVENDLSVIEKGSNKSKAIDQATYQLAMKGKSWKTQLVNDLDMACSFCKGKLNFIDFMNKQGYEVQYKDRHITFKKKGEDKGIRADTLAKQFGEKYTKINLEKSMSIPHSSKYYMKYDKDVGILSLKEKKYQQASQKEKTETEKQKNFRINKELKLQSAQNNDKLCYKVITPEQLEQVKLTDTKIAYFDSKKESDKINIVYLNSEAGKIDYAVYNEIKSLKR
jgi:predicted lactoylglutathione lyase